MSLPSARYKSDTSVVRFYARLIDRVAALPGVGTVGITSRLPLEATRCQRESAVSRGRRVVLTKLPPLQLFTAVGGDYFNAMKIPLLAGKAFDRTEAQRADEVMISLSSAQAFWKDSTGASALGKRFRPLPTGRLYTVIGVVGDTRDTALAAPPAQVVYFPEALESNGIAKRTQRAMALVARTAGGASIDAAVRQAVHDLDPTVPTFDMPADERCRWCGDGPAEFVIIILGAAACGDPGPLAPLACTAYWLTSSRSERASWVFAWPLRDAERRGGGDDRWYGIGLAGVGMGIGLALFVPLRDSSALCCSA